MAIGTAAAIGLGVAGVGSVLSSSSNRKAASKAAGVSEANNQRNVALQREIYGKNEAALSPFMQRGNAAGDQLNAMLLGAPAQQQQPNALSQFSGPSAASMYGLGDGMSGYNPAQARDFSPMTSSWGGGQAPNSFWQARMAQQPMAQGVTTQQATPAAAGDPFETFRNSTGYQFRMNEAMDGVNSGYAAGGVLQSGAALKAAQDRAADVATESFGQYAGMLQGQQAVGAGAASSLAGVGQNFANSVTASNNMNSANQANALLMRGQNNFGNTLGMVGGVLAGLG